MHVGGECLTPTVCRGVVSRFEVDDFDLTEVELVALRDPAVRNRLDDAVREVADFEAIAAEALGLWRERRA